MDKKNDFLEIIKEILNVIKDILIAIFNTIKNLLLKGFDAIRNYDYATKFNSAKQFISKKYEEAKNGGIGENLNKAKDWTTEKLKQAKDIDYNNLAKDVKGTVQEKITEIKTMEPKKMNKYLVRIIIVLFILVFIMFLRTCTGPRKVSIFGDGANRLVEKTKNVDNFDELNITIQNPEMGQQIISDEIVNGNIARKTFRTADYTYKLSASKDKNVNLSGYLYKWGSRIQMISKCDDFREVKVEASIAVENSSVIKAEWADNNTYYCMTTDEMVSREAFLQEVNRVVIQNHIYDAEYAESNKNKASETTAANSGESLSSPPEDIQKLMDKILEEKKAN